MTQTVELHPGARLTAGGVARLIGVSRSTVWRWATSGQLPSVRTPGGGYSFTYGDIRPYIPRPHVDAP